ncbi:MAG TPA: DNA polymerase III subunit delta [Steroidobacteraceae bacterium]|nr:DNA polymerase III subunit delta [Steroidobacteraceae bacterium]
MKLTLDNLPRHLAERLAPVYLVSGDEPLLTGEALQAIRARALALGFEEREQVFIERSAAIWEHALAITRSRSLFASRRILEIRMANGKPGYGAATLLKLIAAAGDELLLLIVTGKLDRETQGTAWVRAVQERGAWLALWPPSSAQFPDWLERRLRAAGLELATDAVALLAEATEGNLLAAQQEIEKLRLCFGSGAHLGRQDLTDVFGDSARFQILQLTEAIGAAEAARALRILAGLRAEGDEPVRVLWWLLRSLRAHAEGVRRLPTARLVARAARVDRVAKGQAHGDAWDQLALLVVELCGRRTLPLPRFAGVWERARA